ncbi:phage terminase large subunit-like protein [Roseovarius sp. MBR-78]|jgi:phage terminase large subunit-like protein|uniref:terminase large subunit domain-containing protein n=1 Tax=Roseovarius sp. MBR-78 TaxID=3156460 RepID=UPI003397A419
MTMAGQIIDAVQGLTVPQGPLAGEPVTLAKFQREFIEGAFSGGVNIGCLSVGRGAGKTALSAALAVTHLLGHWDDQAQREIVISARTLDQARTCFRFCASFVGDCEDVTIRRGNVLEIEYQDATGPHLLKAIASQGKTALGGSATLAILDERAAWPEGRGDELESALLTSLGKRDGRALLISTSAPDDGNAFSRWLDTPPRGCYVQEHRAAPDLAADDWPSLLQANPGVPENIGPSKDWLLRAAAQAIERGGNALASFRNLHRNERVNTEARQLLIELEQWAACEVDMQPSRQGPVCVGLDLGASASMTAAAFYWPDSGRLETLGWFPDDPSLAVRGVNDGVGRRYQEMADRGELRTMTGRTVPVALWIEQVLQHVAGESIATVLADRFKQGEVQDGLQSAGYRGPVTWRGFGWRDGAEDITRFQRAVYDRQIAAPKSLLLRAALSDAVCLSDPAGNLKLAKGRSLGRIDPAAAAVLAIAEGQRMASRPVSKARMQWA